MAGYKYDWKCPSCGTSLQLKMRVTQTKRKCPHCGHPVTPEEIDRQGAWKGIGCLAILVFMAIMCGYTKCQMNRALDTASTPSPTPKAVTSATAQVPAVTTYTPEPPPIPPDLSAPESAFKSYLSARWGSNRSVENFMKTLSKKRIRQELTSPILSEDASGKKLGSLENIIAYQFRLDVMAPRTSSLQDYSLQRGYQLLGDAQIKGNTASVWYSNSGHWMVCRLTKEGKDWKVDDHYSYPKKWEEEEFFRKKRQQNGNQ